MPVPEVSAVLWFTADRLSPSDSQNFISPRLETSPSFEPVAASLSSPLRWMMPLGCGFGF